MGCMVMFMAIWVLECANDWLGASINLIVIMKMIQKSHSMRGGAEGKENEPTNAIQKLRSRAEGKKLGLNVKQKILRTPHQDVPPPFAQRNPTQYSEERTSLAMSKSVSFDGGRADSPGLLRHHSKKSILKNSLSRLQSSLSLKVAPHPRSPRRSVWPIRMWVRRTSPLKTQ
jgi:hypothetical protein